MDYGSPGAWESLVDHLERRHAPVPRGCDRVNCEPGWTWTPTLPDYDLWFVIAGRGHARLRDRDISLRPGTLLALRPGDDGAFDQEPTDRLTVLYCHFGFVDVASGRPVAVEEDWLPSRHVPVTGVAHLSQLMHRIIRLSRDPHPMRRLERSAAFLTALIEVYLQDARAQGHPVPYLDPRIQEVIDYIRDEPGRRPTLTEAARIARLSPAHLSRLFSRQLGTSFRQFVVEARLERAHGLLTETTMTVTEISAALGYTDVFLFSRQFRKRYGQPPSRARTRVASGPSAAPRGHRP